MFGFFRKNNHCDCEKLTLKLSGLHCSSCAVNIDLSLEDLPGVINSTTNYARSHASVDYLPEKTTPEQIIAEIKKLGYEAEGFN